MLSFIPLFWLLLAFVLLGYSVLAWWIRRVSPDARVSNVIRLSYLLRVFLGAGLYAISYWGWPLLPFLQTERGFWSFGLDGPVYHFLGAQIAYAWRVGVELPDTVFAFEYFAMVAALYNLLGAHPLYPIFLNAGLASANGLLASLLGKRLFGPRAAFGSAVLVACWPSSLIWSAQLLKDPLSWVFILTTLLLLVSVIQGVKAPGYSRRWWVGRCLALAIAVMVLTRLRFYLGSSLSIATLLVLASAAAMALRGKQWAYVLRYAGIVLVVIGAMLFARTLNTAALLSPRDPAAGHYRLARQHLQIGELEEAAREFNRTIVADSRYRKAYLDLAAVQIQRQQWAAAIIAYEGYLALGPTEEQPTINNLLVELYVRLGNDNFRDRRVSLAIAAYERAIALDPGQVEATANLGLALAQQGTFDRAFAMAERALALAGGGLSEPLRRVIALTYKQEALFAFPSMRIGPDADRAHYLEIVLSAYRRATAIDPSLLKDLQASLGFHSYVRLLPLVSPEIREWWLQSSGRESSEPTGAAVQSAAPLPLEERNLLKRDSLTRKAQRFSPFGHQRNLLEQAKNMAAISNAGLKRDSLTRKAQRFSPFGHQVTKIVGEMSPPLLASRRQGFVAAGGHSLTDPSAMITDPKRLLGYLPRALAVGFLAPFPRQWFDTRGSTGVMRLAAGAEMLLLYFLLPSLLVGVWHTIRQRHPEGLVVLGFILLTALGVSLVVANLGTLFRLRLLFLLPLLPLAIAGEPVGMYRRAWAGVRHTWRRGRRVARKDTAAASGAKTVLRWDIENQPAGRG